MNAVGSHCKVTYLHRVNIIEEYKDKELFRSHSCHVLFDVKYEVADIFLLLIQCSIITVPLWEVTSWDTKCNFKIYHSKKLKIFI